MRTCVRARPHAFPRSGELRPEATALVVVDMQVDFCGEGGYMDRLGCDLALLRAPIEPIRRVLAEARTAGLRVVHTREGYGPDLADLQPWKRRDGGCESVGIGDRGPLGRALIRGEPCWDFVPELKPEPGEPVFDKPGFGVFAFTDLDAVLRDWRVENLVLMGVTTDCCVHSVLREAVDRGYDCLVLEDCVGASSRVYHETALALVGKTTGIWGALSDSVALVDAIAASRRSARG